MTGDEQALRGAVVAAMRELERSGLNQGTSGNVSVRFRRASFEALPPAAPDGRAPQDEEGGGIHLPPHAEVRTRQGEPRSTHPGPDALLITPSGIPAERLRPEDIVLLEPDGTSTHPLAPSSEWRFHRDILRSRPEIGAVVHAHPTYATAFAICRQDVPAAHYMIAAVGGPTVRCARYETFGTAELSDAALEALEGRAACLLANHGLLAMGPDLGRAMWLAVEVETLCRQLAVARAVGVPVILPDEEIARVQERFRSYGPRTSDDNAPTPSFRGAAGEPGTHKR